MTRKTPYQRIIRAAKSGTGVRLSAEECFELSLDAAIEQVAMNDDDAKLSNATIKVVRP